MIRYEDLPPQENPFNADEELWIEVKSNDVAKSDTWLQRKIEAQCDTGEVRVAAADGSDSKIINLTEYSYHFIKPPHSAAASTASESGSRAIPESDGELWSDSEVELEEPFTKDSES